MSQQGGHFLARGDVPQADGGVERSDRQSFAIGREGYGVSGARASVERRWSRRAVDVPDKNEAGVAGRCNHVAVR